MVSHSLLCRIHTIHGIGGNSVDLEIGLVMRTKVTYYCAVYGLHFIMCFITDFSVTLPHFQSMDPLSLDDVLNLVIFPRLC